MNFNSLIRLDKVLRKRYSYFLHSVVLHSYILKELCMNKSLQRRVFLISAAACGTAFATGVQAQAAATLVDEKNAQAVALGYVADAKRVDVKKFTQYATGQVCSNCALYQGKPADKAANCPLFAGKQVAGAGWCSAYAKKA